MRLQRMRQTMESEGVRGFLVRDTSNIAWLTGFSGVFDEEQAHALLVTADRVVLHTDSRYSAACRAAAEGGLIQVDDTPTTHAKWLSDQLGGRIADSEATLGIEDGMPVREYLDLCTVLKRDETSADGDRAPVLSEGGWSLATSPALKLTSDVVVNLRAVKDVAEVKLMQAAQDVTDAAFTYITGYMKPGMTERQVQAELDDWMRRNGADGLAFPSIVATGPHGASPHAQPSDTVLEAGQCVVMDFGARVAGYCSDMTRTVFLGQPDAQLAKAYTALRASNEAVEALLKPGVTGAQAHQLSLDVLAEAGFPNAYSHGLGHGVGLDIHEQPVLSPRNTKPLVAGNVVTVEPGIYVDGAFGMRLEDCGIVTDAGFRPFTRSTHEMTIV